MTDLLEFVSGLLDGVTLLALVLVLGGIGCSLAVLRVTYDSRPLLQAGVQRVLVLTLASAMSFAGLRTLQLIMKPLALALATGASVYSAFFQTRVFQFLVISVVLALELVGALVFVKRQVGSASRWCVVLVCAEVFMVNEGWLTHAASRLEGGGMLMVVTMIHVLGATVWAGGIAHVLLLWKFLRQEDSGLWPELVSRFSSIGITCISLIVVPGIYLAWRYVGGWSGLVGTGYGNLVLVKVGLLACVLVVAALNFFAARAWNRSKDPSLMQQRVPIYIEVEIILAVALLFSAASLTGFPPSVDVPKETASPAEMWSMFNPKVPRLAGPELILIDAPELTDLRTGKMGKKEDLSWDRFNHNFSGVMIIALAIVALFDRLGGFRWARYWPLMFMGFSVILCLPIPIIGRLG